MNYEVNGQDDLTLAIGAGGDKTLTIPVTGSHLIIRNDATQPILYTLAAAPTFPVDWNRVDSKERTEFEAGAAVNLYLRKKVYYRAIGFGQLVADINDVTANVEVDQITR